MKPPDLVANALADADALRCHPDCGICNACTLAAQIDALAEEVKQLRQAIDIEAGA